MTYIKLLITPLIIITGLAFLTACGGSATPATDDSTTGDSTTTTDCAETPFDAVDMCEDEKDTACLAHGTNVANGGHASCATRENVITACTTDPYSHNGCNTARGINGLRMTFCAIVPANRFNAMCISGGLGDDDRDTFCSLSDNLFMDATECADLGNINDLRTKFCAMSANVDNEDCVTRNNLKSLCNMPDNLFRADCIKNDFGGDNRSDFCGMRDNQFNADCIANNLGNEDRILYCNRLGNLFDEGCLANGLGDDTKRDPACLDSPKGSPIPHASCSAARLGVVSACEADPFTKPGCTNLDTIVDIRTDYCGKSANAVKEECNVTHTDWAASVGNPSNEPIRISPAKDQRNQFLNAGNNGLDAAANPPGDGAQIHVPFLNLDGTNSGDGITDNPIANSVSYYSIPGRSGIRYYYAGIDSRVALGKPNFQNTGTVTWGGQFQVLLGAEPADILDAVDFELTIDFETQTIESSLIQQGSTNNYFHLEGCYDSKGVIDGTVNYTQLMAAITDNDKTTIMNHEEPEGILTGLIGERGAIGAFLSGTGDKSNITDGNSATEGFAGGFVAAPPVVNTGDLPTYETKSNEIMGSGFLTATATGLNTTDLQFPVGQPRTIAIPHFIGRRGLDSDNPDGFAYFTTTSPIFTPAGYAGILPTTNLGAPLEQQPANAVWAGHFSVTGTNNIATNYYVDFTNGKFGFSNAAEDDTDGTLTVGTATYTMNAVFGSHASAKDEDEVRFNAGRMGGNLSVVDTGLSAVNVTITGLIGEEGAVGVFAQVGEGKGITGGFTATNPDYTPPE